MTSTMHGVRTHGHPEDSSKISVLSGMWWLCHDAVNYPLMMLQRCVKVLCFAHSQSQYIYIYIYIRADILFLSLYIYVYRERERAREIIRDTCFLEPNAHRDRRLIVSSPGYPAQSLSVYTWMLRWAACQRNWRDVSPQFIIWEFLIWVTGCAEHNILYTAYIKCDGA